MTFAKKAPRWMRQAAALPAGTSGAGLGTHQVIEQVYGLSLPPNAGLTAFAYLWRRFGPPWHGCDGHKDLVGYILGTPHPAIWLDLHPGGDVLQYSVGYLMTAPFQEAWRAPVTTWEKAFEAWWVATNLTPAERQRLDDAGDPPSAEAQAIADRFWRAEASSAVRREAEAAIGPFPTEHWRAVPPDVIPAITTALEELLRPVFIRDVPITILGRLDDAHGWPKGTQAAPPSPYAGYGIPQEAMDALRKDKD